MFEVASHAIWRCPRCRFVQVGEEPSAATLREIYAGSYFETTKYDDDANQLRENRRRLSMLSRLGIASGARVLDAGCATGDFLEAAGDYEMWGVDISDEAVAIAQKNNPRLAGRISAGGLEAAPFEPGFFDAVVLWDVIEHLWDPRAICERLVELTKPGGHIIISTPDIGALTARLFGRRWVFMTPPEHLGFFSKPSATWLFEKELGLEIILSFTAGKWVNAGFLSYKLRRVLPELVPERLVSAIGSTPVARLPIYVPTRDIRYLAARRPLTS